MTYVQEHDFTTDRCRLWQASLISLAHGSISMQQLTSFELRLRNFLCIPLRQGMVGAVGTHVFKIPMKDSEAHTS